jgi:uncharacterized membrane protein YsdA (DUF1294 family)
MINAIQIYLVQIFLVIINVVALAMFGIDKLNSKKRRRRIKESSLLLVAFFGPFGAYAAM